MERGILFPNPNHSRERAVESIREREREREEGEKLSFDLTMAEPWRPVKKEAVVDSTRTPTPGSTTCDGRATAQERHGR